MSLFKENQKIPETMYTHLYQEIQFRSQKVNDPYIFCKNIR